MGRAPCCDKANVKRGPWSPEEDDKLKLFIEKQGTGGNWIALPQKAGLRRCGKSCRLRWLNYLRPNIKHGEFSDDEDRIICTLFASIGSRWSIIANQLPGRTDNDIKNYWNTKLKKKLLGMSPSPNQHLKRPHLSYPLPSSNNTSHFLVQNYSMPSPYSFSQAYESGNSNYCSTMAFTTPNSGTNTLLQAQDGCLGLTTQVNYNQVKHCNNNNSSNLIIFGGEAASCSSSDGSCTTNHVGRGRDQVEQDHGENLGLQSYFTNGGYVGGDEKTEGAYGENPLDYSIEEIKQLISTNSVCTNNLNFFVDDIKTEDKEIYY